MQNQNKVTLEFDANIALLAGYEFGKQVYDKQVENLIDYNDIFYIEFPDSIEAVASSFVQGFFFKLKKIIGTKNIKKRLRVLSNDDTLEDSIMHNIY